MSDPNKITVLLVEDGGPTERAFRQALSKDNRFTYLGNALGRKNFEKYVMDHVPDLIVLDLFLPRTGALLSPHDRRPSAEEGFWHIESAKKLSQKSKAIVWSDHFLTHPEFTKRVLELGADAYLPKHNAPQDGQDWNEWLTHSLWIVYRGTWKPDVEIEFDLRSKDIKSTDLSEREIEILHLLAKGKSDIQTGEALCITENTVRSHVKNILGKLRGADVHNRREALQWARQKGIIQDK